MKHFSSECSNTGTLDQLLQGPGTYQPEIEYFMVDYFDKDKCAHIRLPFLLQEQVFRVCSTLQIAIQGGASIGAIRVLPEEFLDEPYVNPEIVEAAIAAGVEDAKFLGASTREVLFDRRYEEIAKGFRTKALGKQ